MIRKLLVSGLALAASMTAAQARTEITWWHAMGGELGAKLEEIVANYNKSQDQYTVVPTYKGNYTETMTAAIAAFRAHKQPDIVQVFEVGTGTMMAAKGAVYPVYKLMKDTGQAFDPKAFLPAVVGYYTDTDGNMLSMPFNSSTPILYYNKDVFKKAGLDPNAAAQDLGGAGSRQQEDHGLGRGQMRLHLGLDFLGAARELLGLAQPADRHQGERLRRSRHAS